MHIYLSFNTNHLIYMHNINIFDIYDGIIWSYYKIQKQQISVALKNLRHVAYRANALLALRWQNCVDNLGAYFD